MPNLSVAISVVCIVFFLIQKDVAAQSPGGQNLVPSPQNSAAFLNALPRNTAPLIVQASFELHDINAIDDESETFEFAGTMRLSWHDPRQAFDPESEGIAEKLYIGDYQFNEVYTGWWPQVVLVNEAGMDDRHGVMLRILPDGHLTLIETINAVAEADFDLRRYPFDNHQVRAVFEVFGFGSDEVVMKVDAAEGNENNSLAESVRIPQWELSSISLLTMERSSNIIGDAKNTSSFIVSMNLDRKQLFVLRLIVLPLIIIVMLSWSVFWMDKSSLGDRINVSFIGILTVVAYQLLVGDILPRISYVTFMYFFLSVSFIIMCFSVVINLWVSQLDRSGKGVQGDRLDRRCRWIFPLVYFGLILIGLVWGASLE